MGIRKRVATIDQELWSEPGSVITHEDLAGLPDPIRRWIAAAGGVGALRSPSVRLRIEGEMKPKPGASSFEIKAEETIGFGRGFVWKARSRIGLFQMSVLDAYHRGDGFMRGRFIGIVPLMNAAGDDITRSSRHRLAAESALFPTGVLPRDGLLWSPVDDASATATFTIDGEDIPVTVTVDDAGDVAEVTMERWGDVRRDGFGLIPYGYRVEETRDIGGLRFPIRVRGGWWYGSDRYEPDDASMFEFVGVLFPSALVGEGDSAPNGAGPQGG